MAQNLGPETRTANGKLRIVSCFEQKILPKKTRVDEASKGDWNKCISTMASLHGVDLQRLHIFVCFVYTLLQFTTAESL